MSVLKKIGFDEVLEKLGLSEAQVQVIYKNELADLEKQERQLLENIEKLAGKTNDLYSERQRAAQVLEGERLEIQQARKHLVDEKTVITNMKNDLLQIQRDTNILRERLNEDKALFRQEKDAIAKWKEEILAEKHTQEDITRNLREKEDIVEKSHDELILRQHKIAQQESAIKELRERAEFELKDLEAEKFKVNTLKETVLQEIQNLEKLKEDYKIKIEDGSEALSKKIEAFKKEVQNERDALRHREYLIVEREKALESKEADLKAQKETIAIKKSKKAVTEG